MIRYSNRRIVSELQSAGKRRFSTRLGGLRNQNGVPKSGTPPPAVKETVKEINKQTVKKKFSLTKAVLTLTVLGTATYAGTLYAATKNSKVLDFVIDKQLPYYEELIDFIEHGSLQDIQDSLKKLQKGALDFNFPSKDQLNELTHKLESKGEDILSGTKKWATGSLDNKEIAEGGTTPAQQLQKPVEIESVKKTIEHLPLINVDSDFIDSTVRSTIDSFNALLKSIDVTEGKGKDTLVKNISQSVQTLSTKINKLTEKFDEELQNQLKKSQTDYLASYTKKELELTENLLDQFNHEKQQLEKKLNQRLVKEIEATKETISQAAVNAVSMVRIEQSKNFEKLVKEKIDQERAGRLANLEKLDKRLVELEEFATSLESQLKSNHAKALVFKSLSKLKSIFSSDSAEPVLISPYVAELSEVSKYTNDELIELALAELRPLIAKESTASILTVPQLLTRFELLAPDLRSASLLPPNAGLLGHFSSFIFSKLLLPVKGSKPSGKDIESLISRVENNLAKGRLDDAVEEVANLKGWPRKLAGDWVQEGRKRLELEYLVGLIEAEAKIA